MTNRNHIATIGTVAALAAACALVACAPKPQDPADLIVTGGRVYTADSAHKTADAIAVKAGRIVYVGDKKGAMAYKGATTTVEDVAGATVIPGMTDAHAHVVNLGLRGIDLMGTDSYDDVIAKVVERAKSVPKGEWIIGRGWDQNDWPVKNFPTHEKLTKAVPDHPVILTRVDGHAILVNDAALRLAKVTGATKDPVGGHIERAANGAPAGVFVDNAMDVVRRVVPAATLAQTKDAILAAQDQMLRWGLTGVHDAGEDSLAIQAYDALGKEGKLELRYYVMLADNANLLKEWFSRNPALGLYDGTLTIRMIKAYMDGAMGSRGAALLAPYADDPKQSGLLRTTPEHIREIADQALLQGYQFGVHA
ncbi:MAG TPA: amidohydrolase family protein, partial [Gemmatimonadaceae bacterium]|nr:amidohydrolase family protein [Gemmatimonadaceae bacterium]